MVKDTVSDLPRIENGVSKLEMSDEDENISHFQKMIHRGSEVLKDHVTKPMSSLDETRLTLIPTVPGSQTMAYLEIVPPL